MRRTLLLDSPADVAFDRLTRLASKLLDAPVALVTLVDQDRQFFKSCIGLPEPWASLRETPLSHSFCQHTIASNEPLVIEDARTHPLVIDNLAIPELNVVAYAGVPLIASDGQAIGAFCVIDSVPRRWSNRDLDILKELTTSVMTEIELKISSLEAQRRAEEAEQERQQKVAILESSLDAFFAVNTTWHCTYVNAAAEQLLGYSRAEMIGNPAGRLFPQLVGTTLAQQLLRAMTEQVPVEFEAFYAFRNIWLEARAFPTPDGVSVFFRDISERKRVEQELHQREQEFVALAQHTPDVVTRIDRQLRYLFANQAMEQVTGIPASLFPGKTNLEIGLSPEQDVQWSANLQAVLDTGIPRTHAFEFVTQAGARWFEAQLVPEFAPDGTVASVLTVSRDITDLKRARDVQYFLAQTSAALAASLDYQETLNQIAHLVVPFLADVCVVALLHENNLLRHTTVAHIEPLQAATLHEIMQRYPHAPAGINPLWQAINTQQPVLLTEIDQQFLTAYARDEYHLRLMQAIGPVHTVVVIPLIAREKVIGAILFGRLNNTASYTTDDIAVGREVARRAASAVDHARLYQAAQQAVHSRDELLSVVTHDLKNPLSVITGYAALAQRRLDTPDQIDVSQLQYHMTHIEQAASKMSVLLDELLDSARLQAGQTLDLHRRPVDLVRLVCQVVAEQQQTTRHHRLSVQTELTELVGLFDAPRMERVLNNLIGNAIKYSPRGGAIIITLTKHNAPEQAILGVRDQGVGIPATDLPRIFERFHRASNVVGRIAGTGIGLASARQIITQHGGTLLVESVEGAGTTFTLHLPITPQG